MANVIEGNYCGEVSVNILMRAKPHMRPGHRLNNYIATKELVCFPLKLQKYIAVIFSLFAEHTVLFSWGDKHNVDCDSGGFGTSSLVKAEIE
jgi:hypothetical protein